MTRWATIACDQYTSQPEYWKSVFTEVGDAPSTLAISLPEVFLEDADVEERIARIKDNMRAYLSGGTFAEYADSMVFVERTLPSGKVRRGIVGCFDLEEYDYAADSVTPIRATEGTIISRLPPRVRIRSGAELELPHILVLYNDPTDALTKELTALKGQMDRLYSFPLMQGAGSIAGWHIKGEYASRTEEYFAEMHSKLLKETSDPLQFAVGDGNHSLATAKQCYENLKKTLPADEYLSHPARYVLAELMNVYDESLEFEPIYRVMFDVDPEKVYHEMERYFANHTASHDRQTFELLTRTRTVQNTLTAPPEALIISSVQSFIDKYIAEHGGRVDYIHGEEAVRKLVQDENAVGFLYKGMDKTELFPYVLQNGPLPRKTFSMGHADEKRFYLECRRIVR